MSARNCDLVGRVGGEEFAILLPESDSSGGLAFAERIRQAFASARFESLPGGYQVTASFGVADSHGSATVEALLQAADEPLYRAKAAGRDQAQPAS